MSPFPRPDYAALSRYHFDRTPVELDLSDNTNRWGAHPAALEVLREADGEALARYPDLYADDLRAAVARRLEVPEASVATGCGSDDVLDSTYRAAAGPGDFVSVATPTFSMALPFASMNGMPARSIPWPEALDDPGRLLAGGPSLVYVCRPNNPTGGLAAVDWMDALLGAVGEDGPLVLVDEAYIDFGGDSFALRASEHPRLLVSRTLSKAYGLAGLRVGYSIAHPDTALEVEKSRGPYKVARLSARAAAAALDDVQGWIPRTVAECVTNRARTAEALDARGLPPLPSAANFLLFRAPGGDARVDALAIRERGVAVRPFPETMPDGADGLRVTVAPWEMMERFFEALDGYREALACTP